MPDNNQSYQWTAKLPALLAGLGLILGGVLLTRGRWRYSLPAAAVLIAMGTGLLVYSTTLHNWCAPKTAKFGAMAFGGGFFQAPSVYDCLHLVYGPAGR